MNKPFLISVFGLICLGVAVWTILPDIALWVLLFGDLP